MNVKLRKSRVHTTKGSHTTHAIAVPLFVVNQLKLKAGDLFEAEPIPGSPDHPEPCMLYTRKVKA